MSHGITLNGMRINAFLRPIKTINRIDVRERIMPLNPGGPRFVCYGPDNRALEEFRTRKAAINWATRTRDFV